MIALSSLLKWQEDRNGVRYGAAELVLAALFVAAGAALRAYEIGYSLDLDEVFSVRLAAHSLPEVINLALADRTHPVLHNLLLHFWDNALGDTGVVARTLSVVFATGFLASAYAVARRFVSAPLALATLAIIAVSPFFVYYGQQARPYSLISLLGTLNLLLFLRLIEKPVAAARWMWWFACSVLLINAHYIGALLIGSEMAVALAALPAVRWRLIGVGALAGLSIVPWIWLAFSSKVASGDDPLDLISWMNLPTPEELGWYFVGPFGENPFIQTRWLLAAMTLLLVVGLGRMLLRAKLNARHVLILLLAFAVPVAVFAAAVIAKKPVFADRQLIWALFAFLLAAAFCMEELLSRKVALPVMGALFVWTLVALPAGIPHNTKPPWGDIISYLDDQFPGQSISAFEGWVWSPLTYYRPQPAVLQVPADRDWRNSAPAIVLCRPKHCGNDPAGPGIKKKVWLWGIGTPFELRLYTTGE